MVIVARYGSPSMEDIEAFTVAYREKLDEAENAKSIPENMSLEVIFSFQLLYYFFCNNHLIRINIGKLSLLSRQTMTYGKLSFPVKSRHIEVSLDV